MVMLYILIRQPKKNYDTDWTDQRYIHLALQLFEYASFFVKSLVNWGGK